jgi:hypothetical protein
MGYNKKKSPAVQLRSSDMEVHVVSGRESEDNQWVFFPNDPLKVGMVTMTMKEVIFRAANRYGHSNDLNIFWF